MREVVKNINTKLGYVDAKLEELNRVMCEGVAEVKPENAYTFQIINMLREIMELLADELQGAYDCAEMAQEEADEAIRAIEDLVEE